MENQTLTSQEFDRDHKVSSILGSAHIINDWKVGTIGDFSPGMCHLWKERCKYSDTFKMITYFYDKEPKDDHLFRKIWLLHVDVVPPSSCFLVKSTVEGEARRWDSVQSWKGRTGKWTASYTLFLYNHSWVRFGLAENFQEQFWERSHLVKKNVQNKCSNKILSWSVITKARIESVKKKCLDWYEIRVQNDGTISKNKTPTVTLHLFAS